MNGQKHKERNSNSIVTFSLNGSPFYFPNYSRPFYNEKFCPKREKIVELLQLDLVFIFNWQVFIK